MSNAMTKQPVVEIALPPETLARLRDRATREGVSLERLMADLAEREAEAERSDAVYAEKCKAAAALGVFVGRLDPRTPEQVLADRARILAKSTPPRPLPEGKSLYDVVEGTWPGDESDEQIRGMLEKLS